jgi:hypothetical protein
MTTDTVAILRKRAEALGRLRADPGKLVLLNRYYRDNPWAFINDWGMTYDPRNLERGVSAVVPFVLFPRQIEWCQFTYSNWKDSEYGGTEKSRDMGVTWLASCFSSTLCLLFDGMNIGFGSRKEEYVDKLGDPKSILWKVRFFMSHLPREWRGAWNPRQHAPHMRIFFPDTGSTITGEAGDSIGRGDRKAIYFVDEAAHLERPQEVDQALSATTNCRQDISSANGRANPFAEKMHSGKHRKFTFHWRDDPRKDQAWYDKQCATLDPVTVAQEIDIDYSASVEGIVIPTAWVQAAVDLHKRLGITPTGERSAALDVADRGADLNAWGARHGVVLTHAETWSGKEGDIFQTTARAFMLCDTHGLAGFVYDADGLGAGVRGDAAQLNAQRHGRVLDVSAFVGSGSVHDPERCMIPGRKNVDFFANRKAQSWWALRFRFQAAWRASRGEPYDAEDIISIDSAFPERAKLCQELSQSVYKLTGAGKILIDKVPDGAKSPNLADMVMMLFAPRRKPMQINPAVLEPAYGPMTNGNLHLQGHSYA